MTALLLCSLGNGGAGLVWVNGAVSNSKHAAAALGGSDAELVIHHDAPARTLAQRCKAFRHGLQTSNPHDAGGADAAAVAEMNQLRKK